MDEKNDNDIEVAINQRIINNKRKIKKEIRIMIIMAN